MARKFAELEAKMSLDAIARSDARYRKMVAEMALHELRRARGISQEKLAEALHIKQPNVAKLEKRTDIYISTLRATIEAMGGTLDIVARFPDGDVKITNFSSIDEGGTGTAGD
jgi:DNA-binding Xre family transcriptional regulator